MNVFGKYAAKRLLIEKLAGSPVRQFTGTDADLRRLLSRGVTLPPANTPAGQRVTATVECVGVEGRRLSWAVEVRDEKNLISRGRHERFVIDRERFMASLGGSHEPL